MDRAGSEGIRRKVREFLEGEGQRLHSGKLTLLAQSLGANPFEKVKKMIDAMITRLLEEANQDLRRGAHGVTPACVSCERACARPGFSIRAFHAPSQANEHTLSRAP